jgi:hypothetical protein
MRLWHFAIFRIAQWRLIPWYERSTCDSGCCVRYVFTWLFFEIGFVSPSKKKQS